MATREFVVKTRLILYDRGKILLLKQTKPNGGNYTLVGGTVEDAEFARDALIRESLEEAGIVLKKEDLTLVHVMHKKRNGMQRLTLYFRATRWEGSLRAREKQKFKDAQWFDLESLPKNLTPQVRAVLQSYRQGVVYSEIK